MWIPVNMKKIDEYPHNEYPTDMGTGTRRILSNGTHTLPAPLTSLVIILTNGAKDISCV